MKNKLLYWIPTVLLLLVMVGSAISYLMDIPKAAEAFMQLGYPSYVLYFNATAKILGGIAILSPVPRFLKEWAYAGYLFILLLATQAIYMRMSLSNAAMMLIFIGIWGLSYWGFKVQK